MKKKLWIVFVLLLLAGMLSAQSAYVNYAEALQKSLYFYDAEKCGFAGQNRLEWRGPCHMEDAKVTLDTTSTNLSASFIAANKAVLDPDGDGAVNVIGGFHDAGDHVQFGLPQGYAASTLGWGLYEFKQAFIDIGEYDHMLEILKYFTDFFLRCSFKNSAGDIVAFCYQTGDGARDHVYWGPPELQTLAKSTRPIWFATTESPASDQCGEAAAALAIMYLNYGSIDSAYAANCLDTAKALYKFGAAYRGIGFSGGFYGSGYEDDELAWAAVWLYVATGNTSYIDDIMKTDASGNYSGYVARIVENDDNEWQNAWVHCWDVVWGGVFTKLSSLFPDNAQYDYYSRWNIEYWSGGEIPHETSSDSNYLNYTPGGYGMINTWGSCRYNTAAQLCGLVYAKYKARTDIPEWAKGQMTYIMGANPLNRSYIVGYGNNPVLHPHHRAAHGSLTQDMNVPPNHRHTLWGALAGGPDGSDQHRDLTTDYAYNEVAIDYNAAFVGALAGLYESYGRAAGQQPVADFPPPEPPVKEYYVEAKMDEENAQGTQITLRLHVEAMSPPRFESGVLCRYFFNISEITEAGKSMADIITGIYYDEQAILYGGPNVVIDGPKAYDAANGVCYIDINWGTAKMIGSRELMFIIQVKQDYTGGTNPSWDGTNDYSRQGITDSYAETDRIAVYHNGFLVSGQPSAGGSPTSTPTRTSTRTPTRTPAGSGTKLGDVNSSGTVDIVDALMTAQYYVGLTPPNFNSTVADTNRDGKIDIIDALRIAQFYVGLITSL